MKKRYIILFFCFVLVAHNLLAQDNMIFMGRNTPQKFLINPALHPEDRFFISFPIIGGISEQLNTNIAYSDIFTLNTNNKETINANLINSLKENNQIRNVLNLDILHLGFKIGRKGSYMGISVGARTTLDASISKDVFSFLMDNPIDKNKQFMLNLIPDALSWAEAGIAFSQRLSRNFTIGIRVKGLMGFSSAQADNITILADKSFDKYIISGDVNLKTGNVNLLEDEGAYNDDFYDYYDDKETIKPANFSSPGFAVDLGISYVSDDKRWNAYASISDFGRLYWSDEYSTQIVSSNPQAKYEWTGVKNIDDIINGSSSFKDQLENVLDEMTAVMGLDTVRTSFTSKLPMTLQAGVRFSVDRELKHNLSLNMLYVMPQYAKKYYEFTAGYTYSTKNKRWDIIGSYTYKSLSPFNIGIGGLYRGRGFEIFLMSDSVNSFFDYKSARSTVVRFGMNFYCGGKRLKNKY